MREYIVRRFIYTVPLLIMISFFSFVIITLPPGDYFSTFQNKLMSQSGLSREEAKEMTNQMRKVYGLDKPFLIQYFTWIKNIVLKGDFGYSLNHRKPVSEVIWVRLGMTILIALGCYFLSVFVGVVMGIFSALKKYSIWDTLITVLAFLGLSIPNFFFALILMYILGVKFGFHVGGLFSPDYAMAPWSWAKFVDFLKHFWVPVVVVGTAGTARNMRVMRSNLLDVLNKQYIKVARSKGISEYLVIYKHALKNAIQPIIMYLGMSLPFLITGSIVSSIVLNLPTTGPMFYDALINQDMYLAGSFLMMLAIILVIGNFISDIILAWLDPRVSYE